MRKFDFIIPEEYSNKTVQQFVRKKLGLSSRVLIKLKNSDMGIQVNGNHVKTIDKLNKGDKLTLLISEKAPDYFEEIAQNLQVEVLYEDEDFIVLNKPHGMPVHPASTSKDNTLLNAVAYVGRAKGESYPFRPIYRLDKDTSGALVVAKHKIASSAVITKDYYAVCEGKLKGCGEINAPIEREEGSTIKRQIGGDKTSITLWEEVFSDDNHTLVKLNILTGRTHQIRVHMASIGHPLAGDDLYGGKQTTITRQALHCKDIHIAFNALDKHIDVTSDFPKDIKEAFPRIFIEL